MIFWTKIWKTFKMATEEEREKAIQIAREVKQKSQERDNLTRLRVTRFSFLIAAGIQLLSVWLYLQFLPIPLDYFLLDFIIAGMFGAMFVLSFWYPFPSFVIALLGYVIYQTYLASYSIEFLFSGWIWKVIILTALVIGMMASRKLPRKSLFSEDILDLEED